MSEEAKKNHAAVFYMMQDIEASALGLKSFVKDECRPDQFSESEKHVVRGWINRIEYELNQLRRTVDGESEEGELTANPLSRINSTPS